MRVVQSVTSLQCESEQMARNVAEQAKAAADKELAMAKLELQHAVSVLGYGR